MKHKIFVRGISMVLCGVMVLSLCGCDSKHDKANAHQDNIALIEPMEIETVNTYGFDFLGGTDVMPILGFYGPSPSSASVNGVAMPDYVTDEIFEAIADCGINLLGYSPTDYNKSPEYVLKMLELGEKYGVGITVTDSGISEYDEELTLNKVDERIKEYSNYPAFCGVYGVDEPSSATFPGAADNISVYANKINLLSELGVWSYGNLMPCANKNLRDNYNDYIEEWLSTCKVEMLLWDYYVHNATNHVNYFYHLSLMREKAEKYDVPFWVFVQAGGQHADGGKRFDSEPIYPSEGEFVWNINTSLAYGAKGLAYFPLIQPHFYAYAISTPYDFERNGIIGASGNKNRWWYYAQNVHKQVTAVDEVLMNAVNKGVIVTTEQARQDNVDSNCIIEGTSWRELADISGNVMVGCFNYQGKSAYYVVNYDKEYAQNITMKFQGDCNFTVTQEAETKALQGNGVELTMRPGEGVLVVME